MKGKVRFANFAFAPLCTVAGFLAASLVFAFVLKNPAPVPVFAFFGTVTVVCMVLYALLPGRGKRVAQVTSRVLIGGSLLFFGFAGMQNFQIEGLVFSTLAGVFSGVTVHYIMGKIVVPVIMGRTWCSWNCWTILVLDFLPFKAGKPWKAGLGRLRLVHFALSVALCAALAFGFGYLATYMAGYDPATGAGNKTMLYWFLGGNLLYWIGGAALCVAMKDNRAFCKYACPVTVFLKLSNMIALSRIKGDAKDCTNCGSCAKACPMSIDIPSFVKAGKRVLSTECTLCLACVKSCPKGALRASAGFDLGVGGTSCREKN